MGEHSFIFSEEKKMKKTPRIIFLFLGLYLGLIYRQPKNSAFDNRYSVKRFNIPYREPEEDGLGALDDIDRPDTSVFRNLENIYEMVLEAKNEVDDLKDGVTQEYEKILRRYQKQAAGALV